MYDIYGAPLLNQEQQNVRNLVLNRTRQIQRDTPEVRASIAADIRTDAKAASITITQFSDNPIGAAALFVGEEALPFPLGESASLLVDAARIEASDQKNKQGLAVALVLIAGIFVALWLMDR